MRQQGRVDGSGLRIAVERIEPARAQTGLRLRRGEDGRPQRLQEISPGAFRRNRGRWRISRWRVADEPERLRVMHVLSGFASRAAALAYDYQAPLRWFPGEIAVTETDDGSGFPHPAYALQSASSSPAPNSVRCAAPL